MKIRKATVTIAGREESLDVEAVLVGDYLAVHSAWLDIGAPHHHPAARDARWTVTHRPSGYAILTLRGPRRLAVRAAEILARHIPMEKLTPKNHRKYNDAFLCAHHEILAINMR